MALYNDLESCINIDRPAVVFDCSMLRGLDRTALHILLCCLEEAMKRNGDVRLAALRPETQATLRSYALHSLFQCFETVGEAIESFHRPQIDFMGLDQSAAGGEQSEMSAA